MAVPGGFGDLLYMESLLFCNKQLELIWLISVCLWGCIPMEPRAPHSCPDLCDPELWLILSDNRI